MKMHGQEVHILDVPNYRGESHAYTEWLAVCKLRRQQRESCGCAQCLEELP